MRACTSTASAGGRRWAPVKALVRSSHKSTAQQTVCRAHNRLDAIEERMQDSIAPLKRRRRVHPQHPGFGLTGIGPGVRGGAFKIETVARLQQIVFAVERDFELTAQNEKELLAFVRVGVAAAGLGSDAKQVRLHDRVAP